MQNPIKMDDLGVPLFSETPNNLRPSWDDPPSTPVTTTNPTRFAQRRLVEVTTQRAACAKQRQESATEVGKAPEGLVGWDMDLL